MSRRQPSYRRPRRSRNNIFNGVRDPDQRISKNSFRFFTNAITASTTGGTVIVTELDLIPSNWGARGVAFADLYQKYRITALQVRFLFHPGYINTATQAIYMPGNISWHAGLYYGPKSTFTTPTTITQFIDLPHFISRNDSSPNGMIMRLDRSELLKYTNSKWFQTVATGSDDIEDTQLCLEIASVPYQSQIIAGAADMYVDMEVEFAGSVDPALIPLNKFARAVTEERKREEKEDFYVNIPASSHAVTPLSRDSLERTVSASQTLSDPTPVRLKRMQKGSM